MHSLSLEFLDEKRKKGKGKSHHKVLHLKKKLQSVKDEAVGEEVDSGAIHPGLTPQPTSNQVDRLGQMT